MGAATAARLRGTGRRVIGVDIRGGDVAADLSSSDGRAGACAAVAARAERLVGVATFAGVSPYAAPPDVVVAVNFFGTTDLLAGLWPMLGAAGSASVVVVSSNAATTATDVDEELVQRCLDGEEDAARARAIEVGGPSSYTSAKFAVARWARTSAPQPAWAGRGIAMNVLVPGVVDTPMTQAMAADAAARRVLERIPVPLGRTAVAGDLASWAEFLLGPGARFAVGAMIAVDGGTEAALRGGDWPAPRAPRRPR